MAAKRKITRRRKKASDTPVSAEAKITALCGERDGLMREIGVNSAAQQRAVFALIVAVGVISGFHWEGLVNDEAARGHWLFVGTQLLFVLGLLVIALQCQTVAHSAYIFALEKKINVLAEDSVAAWFSRMVLKPLTSRSAAFVWCAVVFLLYTSALFVLLTVQVIGALGFWRYGVVLVLEAIVIIALIVRAVMEGSPTRESAMEMLGVS